MQRSMSPEAFNPSTKLRAGVPVCPTVRSASFNMFSEPHSNLCPVRDRNEDIYVYADSKIF